MNNTLKVNLKKQKIERQKEEQKQRDEFNQKWIDLLTGEESEKEIEFYTLCEDSPSLPLAIMKYRRILRESGRGEYITVEHLKVANRMPENYLKDVLQKLFLEPISTHDIEFFYKKVSKKYRDMNEAMEELYRRHIEDKGARFLSIALTI